MDGTLSPSCLRFLASFVTAALGAQTFVVDAAGGPGSNFPSIVAAVASAPSGAVLLVRPGSYAGFALVGKGMTILADHGTTIVGTVRIANTSAVQPVTLSQLALTSPTPGSDRLLDLDRCAALVLLERVSCPPATRELGLRADQCTQLALRDCSLTNLDLRQSNTAIEGGILRGWDGTPSGATFPQPAIRQSSGSLSITGFAQVYGGGTGLQVPEAAVRCSGGSLDLALAFVAAGPAHPPFGGAPCLVLANAQARIDARTLLLPSQATAISGGTALRTPIPALATTSAGPGGTITAEALAEPNQFVLLAVGLAGQPSPVPGFSGESWLDPAAASLVAIGVPQPGVPLASVAVPLAPTLRGAVLAWQAAVVTPQWILSNPSCALIR